MAIVFDAATKSTVNNFSHTNNGNCVLYIADTNPTTVTYGGVSLSLITSVASARTIYVYGGTGLPKGANTVTAGAINGYHAAISYDGVGGFGATNTATTPSSAGISTSLTTTKKNAVVLNAANWGTGNNFVSDNFTVRASWSASFGMSVADTNAITVGSYGDTVTWSSSVGAVAVIIELYPTENNGGFFMFM